MITKEEMDHLLELARLEISLEEKEKLILDVDKILEYINKLSEVDVGNIPETLGGSLNTNI
jgi:aspartyl-tRNA(Asn)/glutamyl-tRNA(Gln) amidotransferase subunit C